MKFKRRNPLMLTQSEIAWLTGTTQSYISEIINGWRDGKPALNRKKLSPEMCEALEAATSVCRESWIWPDRHWNPYIPLDHNGPTMCAGCQHRDTIVQLKANIIARWVFENIESLAPKQILYRMISDLWVGFGSSEWINFAWYHLGATKLRLIVDKGGYDMFKDVNAEHMPWCHSEIRRQGWFFFDEKNPLSKNAPDKQFFAKFNIKSMYTIYREGLCYTLSTRNKSFEFDYPSTEGLGLLLEGLVAKWRDMGIKIENI